MKLSERKGTCVDNWKPTLLQDRSKIEKITDTWKQMINSTRDRSTQRNFQKREKELNRKNKL